MLLAAVRSSAWWRRLAIVDIRDQQTTELLRVLIDDVRLLREQTTALLEAVLRKLEDIECTKSS